MTVEIVTGNLVERIESLVSINGTGKNALRELLKEFHPADLAEVLDELSDEATLAVFNLLAPEIAGEVLDETELEITQFLFKEIPDSKLARILDRMPMDDAARLLAGLELQQAEDLLSMMRPDKAGHVRNLLAYPEGTAGRLMNEQFARLRNHWTVTETLNYLRRIDPEAESLAYLYVTDADERLTGVVPLRRLVTAKPEQCIGEICDARVLAVQVTDEQEQVAEMVAKYDFSAIPVVDEASRLVGIVTVDDIMDVLEEEATEDIQRLGGSEALGQPYFAVPVPIVARKRMGWLLLLFFGGTLTSSVMSYFEGALDAALTLSYFIPLLIGTGGNAGSQTVSTVIRALAVHEVEWSDGLRVLARELATGLIVGSVLGVLGFLYTLFFWQSSISLALVVGLTLPVICTWSKTVASLVPLVAEKFGIDPTVISAPLITTVVDTTGLALYFLIAGIILGV